MPSSPFCRLIAGLATIILLAYAPVLAPRSTAAENSSLEPGPTMIHPRAAHTATTLPDGRVLIAGGCTVDSCELSADSATTEFFDPAHEAFTAGPPLSVPRVRHAALRLRDGQVMVIGGWTPDGPTRTTDIFDPATSSWTPGPEMAAPRADAAVTMLKDGRVLVAGGYDGNEPIASSELYDPETNTFVPAGDMTIPRTSHASVTLLNGMVLIVGGSDRDDHVVASAELFDPGTMAFTPTGSMSKPRYKFGAALLDSGEALVVAGADERDAGGALATTERYAPQTGKFSAGPTLHAPRYKIAGSLVVMPDGGVLVGGGAQTVETLKGDGSTQIAPQLGSAHFFPAASLLADGRVLITGGYTPELDVSAMAWLVQSD